MFLAHQDPSWIVIGAALGIALGIFLAAGVLQKRGK
jgi:hypothetical protein